MYEKGIRERIYKRRAIIDIETTDPNNPLPEIIIGAVVGGTFGYIATRNPIGTLIGAFIGELITSAPRIIDWLLSQD